MKKVIVSNEDALDAIDRAKTQEEAMELLRSEFGANAAFDVDFWFAFYDLPAGKTPAKHNRTAADAVLDGQADGGIVSPV